MCKVNKTFCIRKKRSHKEDLTFIFIRLKNVIFFFARLALLIITFTFSFSRSLSLIYIFF